MGFLSLRRFLASTAAASTPGAFPSLRISGRPALAMPTTTIRADTLANEVNGRPATVFGLTQPDGSRGLITEAEFGEQYHRYARAVPAFLPRPAAPIKYVMIVASHLPYQPGGRNMRTRNFPAALFAGLLLLGTVTSVAAQTDAQEDDAHHPAETQATPPVPSTPGDSAATAAPGGMPGMGMMTPEMMQMMQQMMGQGGMPGMMDQMPMAGMMMCPMMQMMMSGPAGMGMPGMMGDQGILFGTPLGTPDEMTEDRVRALLEQQLIDLGNPRLKLGEIGTASDGSITAEIVTVDGSLVQKLAFNRYPGLVRQIVE